MDESNIIRLYEEMIKQFGDSLPNLEQEPIRFAYYVKLFKYIKSKQQGE
jgi:hypothetical protein